MPARPCVRLLPKVRLDPVTPAHIVMLAVLDAAAVARGRDIWVTCGREGHDMTSGHTKGRALDVRTKDVPDAERHWLLQFVQHALPEYARDWFAQLEDETTPGASAPHLHLQVRKHLVVWPPDVDAAPTQPRLV